MDLRSFTQACPPATRSGKNREAVSEILDRHLCASGVTLRSEFIPEPEAFIDNIQIHQVVDAMARSPENPVGRHAPRRRLSICRQIIEAHAGTIGVEKSDAGGARFFFTLPLATSPRDRTGDVPVQ